MASQPSLQLEWVGQNDNKVGSRVKSHAMKAVQRRKRWESVQAFNSKCVSRINSAESNPIKGNKNKQSGRQKIDTSTDAQRVENGTTYAGSLISTHPGDPQSRRFSPRQPIGHQQQARGSPGIPLQYRQQYLPLTARRGSPDLESEPSLVDDEYEYTTISSDSPREIDNGQTPESIAKSEAGVSEADDLDWEPGMADDSTQLVYRLDNRHQTDSAEDVLKTRHPVSSPQTVLSAARFDPFESLAIAVRPQDRALVDHRIFVLPQLMFRVPTTCALNIVMAGPVSFQASALAYSAAHISKLHNNNENQQSIVHRTKSLHLLNDGIGSMTSRSCLDVLFGIIGLTMLEARFGDRKSAWLHMRGALRLIEEFRDLPAVNNNYDVNWWIPWILITIQGYDSSALHCILHDYPQFYGVSADRALHHPTKWTDPSVVTQAAFEEFLNYLRRVEHLALTHTLASSKSAKPNWLFAVISLPRSAGGVFRGTSIQTTARLASLIYINAALWEYRTSEARTSHFLSSLKQQILDHPEGCHRPRLNSPSIYAPPEPFSIEKLLHVMIEANEDPFLPGRSFFTARMVNVAKRLGGESWDRVNAFLTRCLSMHFDRDCLQLQDESLLVWEEDLLEELREAPVNAHEYYPAADS